ncbi:MAG: 4Fe-4S ferredoxin [Firmicutes bacterium]|nr:4Fe-4S ferredoxin [Bacillota bacterium]
MLAGIVYFSWLLNQLWFAEYDPFKQIFHMNVEGTTGWLVIAGFVIISLITERAWCRFLCPLGAFAGLLSRLTIFEIERDSTCINCKICDRKCPVGITVSEITRMRDTRCIKCMECVPVCPVQSLEVKLGINGVFARVKPLAFAVMSVVMFTLIVSTVQLSGYWNPKSPSIKAVSQITNPSEIKGWMKWADVVDTFKVNEQMLTKELGLPENMDRNKTVKQINKEYNISEEKFRQAVAKFQMK